ncbi:MAG TPA: Crp/Fnr family transcriptional regulator [Candidatus Limnocylindrales bacterium]|nr:Crp/Fnr family transcriptional regulator [Candidatus Limnocylindrales bacterium]
MSTHSPSADGLVPSAPSSGIADLTEMISRALPSAHARTHRRLAETARRRLTAAGEIIVWQGEPTPLTLVVRGHTAFRRTTPDGRQLVLGLATRGDMFGLTSIAAQRARFDLVAINGAEVAVWPAGGLRAMAAADPGLAIDVIDGMARDVVDITERLDGFIHQDARRRVVRILTRYRDLFFERPAVLSRAHLPSMVGTSREMTGRVLRDLEREGMVIRVGRAGLRLLAPARLEEAARSITDDA